MVEYRQEGRVAVLTINRPEARNAVNGDVAASMEAGLDRLEEDEGTWIGIVAGEGPVFSAGADLKAIASGQAAALQTERGGFGGITARERTKPLIAAVDGPALAGGCEIVLSCDLVVASTNARFGIPEVKRSLVAAAGGLFRLPRSLPRNIAMELALRSEEHTSELQSRQYLVCRLLLEKKNTLAHAKYVWFSTSSHALLTLILLIFSPITLPTDVHSLFDV